MQCTYLRQPHQENLLFVERKEHPQNKLGVTGMGDRTKSSMLKLRRASAPMEFPHADALRFLPRSKAFESISHDEGSTGGVRRVPSDPDISTWHSQPMSQLGHSHQDHCDAQNLQKFQQLAAAVTANTTAGLYDHFQYLSSVSHFHARSKIFTCCISVHSKEFSCFVLLALNRTPYG